MKTPSRELKRGDCLAPINPALLEDPLDFIHEEHLREREICAQLDALAGAQAPDRGTAETILEFLRDELPLHLADEEEDLFPLLLRRCQPEDEIDRAIARLTSDHRHADDDTPRVIADLEQLSAGESALSEETRSGFARFAAHARRHLILENAIILPFARLRLTARDIETLRLRMMQRRGLDRLKDKTDAE